MIPNPCESKALHARQINESIFPAEEGIREAEPVMNPDEDFAPVEIDVPKPRLPVYEEPMPPVVIEPPEFVEEPAIDIDERPSQPVAPYESVVPWKPQEPWYPFQPLQSNLG